MKLDSTRLFVGALAIVAGAHRSRAADWSHIMGTRFDRKTTEMVAPASVSGQPRKVWEISAGGGFSSFVTGDGKAYTVLPIEVDGTSRETVVALDRKTGKR